MNAPREINAAAAKSLAPEKLTPMMQHYQRATFSCSDLALVRSHAI
jgi:hypothetical protein